MYSTHAHDDAGLMGRLLPSECTRAMLLAGAVGFLIARCCAGCAAVHQRRKAARPAAMPQNLQRWEGEGGSPVPPVAREVRP
ncbi:hypothetical protein [Comamonas sp. NLF-1-9]|uniref:hypothetical protein n=1 Tax=Comamonas sp. NLF-1-9 TaxID=2853163 RepID=UPI001C44C881|nr:hypothetical protein [Comamonas sp. NLF-1-9]QXL85284.1 hypothetical protein KUD94_04740 [Comamonas sp. NLF-1-9]